jgi:hypothetical protein
MSPSLARVPRWVVESDPTWEKSSDPSSTIQQWNKKGTDIKAISYPSSIYCDITRVRDDIGISELLPNHISYTEPALRVGGSIVKYLSSRYLNPSIRKPPGVDHMLQ